MPIIHNIPKNTQPYHHARDLDEIIGLANRGISTGQSRTKVIITKIDYKLSTTSNGMPYYEKR